jgi:glutaminase
MNKKEIQEIQSVLDQAILVARNNHEGSHAAYIPELALVPPDITNVAVTLNDGHRFIAGDSVDYMFSLQSVAKLVVLIGLLEEYGPDKVFSWVRVEPSGDDFASVARLDQFGPAPSNPMLNAGAIALCSHIPGHMEQRILWLENWAKKLFCEPLGMNQKVFSSERRTGDRNRSLAYLMKSTGFVDGDVEEMLETYFCLCSFEGSVVQASYLPMLLSNRGVSPDGAQIISEETALAVVSIMATCGLYNESGAHLVRTGLPGKSGVSGMILACALGRGGIAVASPRVNPKGTSIRGEIMLTYLAKELGWHFASVRP